MKSKGFHAPTELELAFLRVITRGYDVLERQIESCEISDYDLAGYYDVRIVDGPPMVRQRPYHPIDGPILDISDPHAPQPKTVHLADPRVFLMTGYIDTIMWTDERGFLCSIEVCSIGDGSLVDPCSAYVDASTATPNRLIFRHAGPSVG
jgi:hypothetical protein